MTAIVSPTEPTQLRAIGVTDLTPETYGADILIPANGYFIGVQRKTFPADFLASLYDGRLSTSLVKLTKCEVRILVLEGKPAWTTSGFLVTNDHGYQSFSRSQLRNLLLSAHYELGVHAVWADNLTDTIDLVRDLIRWGAKDRHDSIFQRPEPSRLDRRRWTVRDQAVFVLQGFDGIGPEMARRIYDHFGRIPLRWDTGMEGLEDVDGIGPVRASKLRELFK